MMRGGGSSNTTTVDLDSFGFFRAETRQGVAAKAVVVAERGGDDEGR